MESRNRSIQVVAMQLRKIQKEHNWPQICFEEKKSKYLNIFSTTQKSSRFFSCSHQHGKISAKWENARCGLGLSTLCWSFALFFLYGTFSLLFKRPLLGASVTLVGLSSQSRFSSCRSLPTLLSPMCIKI